MVLSSGSIDLTPRLGSTPPKDSSMCWGLFLGLQQMKPVGEAFTAGKPSNLLSSLLARKLPDSQAQLLRLFFNVNTSVMVGFYNLHLVWLSQGLWAVELAGLAPGGWHGGLGNDCKEISVWVSWPAVFWGIPSRTRE